jgi:C-terminal processing protease CtpA/Prc
MGTNDAKTDGVEVVSVSPAARQRNAGLKVGDVLTDINGNRAQERDEMHRRASN